jgi:alkylation response protein AidB-like acyl-CoA dehydrogenase
VNFAGSKVPADPPATLSAGMLHGAVRSVADALIADVLLVPTKSGQLACVATSDPAVIIEPVVSFDMTRPLADIAINGAPAEVIADGEQAEIALRAAFNIGGAMLASEQLGVAEWCLQSTVDYLIQRRQFGRLLGSYQALKHRCADMWVEVSQARAVARYAAACAATEDVDLPIAAALAQAYCSEVAVRAAELCVQLHGGIGFTWEFPAHLYLKRARSSAVALGTADVHRTRLAALLDLPSQSHALADLSRDSKEST